MAVCKKDSTLTVSSVKCSRDDVGEPYECSIKTVTRGGNETSCDVYPHSMLVTGNIKVDIGDYHANIDKVERMLGCKIHAGMDDWLNRDQTTITCKPKA